jgi:hypothetical protein
MVECEDDENKQSWTERESLEWPPKNKLGVQLESSRIDSDYLLESSTTMQPTHRAKKQP